MFPVALALFALGCPQPGDLENANAYPPPPGGNTAGTSTGGSGTMVNCETACLTAIIDATGTGCKTCHNAMVMLDMGKLDMGSPGLSARLKDEQSQHKGITGDASGCPTGDKIIDSTKPANSWLLKKITNTQGNCGTVMPSTGALGAADQKCVTDFVYCVAGGMAPGGGGSGSTSGGSGGTAAGGGGSGGAAAGGGGSGGAAAGSSGSATGGGGGTGGT
jgi:hypothetical protein